MHLNSKVAVKKRIEDLCTTHEITINELAKKSKLTASTVYSMLNDKSKNPGIVTIESICKGLRITVREFFNSELFDFSN